MLGFEDSHVTDSGLQHLIEKLPQLQGLFLDGTGITDQGLCHLDELTQLQGLGLEGTAITEAAIPHLAKLTQLKRLGLLGSAVSDAGVAKLQQALPNCKITR